VKYVPTHFQRDQGQNASTARLPARIRHNIGAILKKRGRGIEPSLARSLSEDTATAEHNMRHSRPLVHTWIGSTIIQKR
jgi:hypothetical protein